MATVEVRFKVRDSGEFKKKIAEDKKEAEGLIDKIKQAGTAAGSTLLLSLKEARTVMNTLGGDTKQFESAMVKAGVPMRDAKLIASQLNKELNASRKEVLGIASGSDKLAGAMKLAAFGAQAMHQAFAKAEEKLQSIIKLGKVKSLEESTADAMELQKKYDQLQRSMVLTNDPTKFAQVRKNIEEASILHNTPQAQLVQAVALAQETKSAGLELAYNDKGALLNRLAKAAYAQDISPEEYGQFVNSQVVSMKDLGLKTSAELEQKLAITRAGEQEGALKARDIDLKGGTAIAQLMGMRKTTGLAGFREGQAFLQSIADAPGVSGNADKTVNLAENLLGKFADPKTNERMKKLTGVSMRDKEGYLRDPVQFLAEFAVSQKGGKFKLPQTDADLLAAENDPKKASKYKDFFEIFTDKQAREGFIAFSRGREKFKQLRDVSAATGANILESNYEHRMRTQEGELQTYQMRDELAHARKLGEKFRYIANISNVVGNARAEAPGASFAADIAGDVAGQFGPAAKGIVGVVGAAAIAAGTQGTINNGRPAMLKAQAEQSKLTADERAQKLADSQKELAALTAKAQEMGINVNVNVQVADGLSAKVTSEAKKTSKAAESGTRQNKRAGQN
ncbi:MAG TPA: hypothetical protein PLA87_21710 [Pseudomonadota bacterium]|nr:hypothetical protein [Pseudomonadota bacterium]